MHFAASILPVSTTRGSARSQDVTYGHGVSRTAPATPARDPPKAPLQPQPSSQGSQQRQRGSLHPLVRTWEHNGKHSSLASEAAISPVKWVFHVQSSLPGAGVSLTASRGLGRQFNDEIKDRLLKLSTQDLPTGSRADSTWSQTNLNWKQLKLV